MSHPWEHPHLNWDPSEPRAHVLFLPDITPPPWPGPHKGKVSVKGKMPLRLWARSCCQHSPWLTEEMGAWAGDGRPSA